MAYIEIKNLTKSYGDNVVLKDISIEMEEGTLNTLLGASGSGKSTLLRSIAGLEDIDSGTVFQHYALFPNMSILDNVKFGLDMQGIEKNEKERRAQEMINRVGLSGKEDALPRNLSGGQQQRVALARSLVTEPAVLLLDSLYQL